MVDFIFLFLFFTFFASQPKVHFFFSGLLCFRMDFRLVVWKKCLILCCDCAVVLCIIDVSCFLFIIFKNQCTLWWFQTCIYKHTCSLQNKGNVCVELLQHLHSIFTPLTAIDLAHSVHLEFLHAWRINPVMAVSLQLSQIMKPFTEDEGGLNIHSAGTASTALPLPLIA